MSDKNMIEETAAHGLKIKDVKLPDWAKKEMEEAKAMGITDGTNPMQLIPRYQAAIMAKRAKSK